MKSNQRGYVNVLAFALQLGKLKSLLRRINQSGEEDVP